MVASGDGSHANVMLYVELPAEIIIGYDIVDHDPSEPWVLMAK
jgi:hypothetical protein